MSDSLIRHNINPYRCPSIDLESTNTTSSVVYLNMASRLIKCMSDNTVDFTPQHIGAVVSATSGYRSSGSAQMLNCKTEPRAATKCKVTNLALDQLFCVQVKRCRKYAKTSALVRLLLLMNSMLMNLYKHEANTMI